MYTLSELWLQHFWHVTAQNGLLDEEDVALLDEHFSESILGEIGAQRRRQIAWHALEFGLILLPCLYLHFNYGLSIYTAICAFACFSLIACIAILLPIFICHNWAVHVDERFQQLVGHLRHRELCVFSLQHLNKPNSLILPLQRTRARCLRQLRLFVLEFDQASRQLIATSADADKLFTNFIGDDMRSLASLPSPHPPECVDEFIREEGHLQTSALKSLWQLVFLLRSEFLRLSLLALLRHIRQCHPIGFIRHFGLLLHTVWRTSWLSVDTKVWGSSKKDGQKQRKEEKGKKRSPLTRLAICRAQMEWAMERLELLDSQNNGKWPSNSEEGDDELASAICACLQQVIGALKGGRGENQAADEPRQMPTTIPANQDGEDEEEMAQNGGRLKVEEDVDYQIFELDLSSAGNGRGQREMGEEESAEIAALLRTQNGHNSNPAVVNELRGALNQRKDLCLQRELRALARLRGVESGQIAAEELDRVPFSTEVPSKASADPNNEKPLISHGPFGLASMNSADLGSILAQRTALFGSGSARVPGVMAVEEFGDDDEEDKNNTEGEQGNG